MTATHHCPSCGKTWGNVPDHVIQLWHYCDTPTRRTQIRPAATYAGTTRDEARREAWSRLHTEREGAGDSDGEGGGR